MRELAADERLRTGPARPLFTVAEARRWTGGRLETPGPVSATAPGGSPAGATVITGVETDSRYIRPGDLFCALPGERVDGHEFVEAAFRAGAVAALVSRPGTDPPPAGRARLVVPDVLEALGRLARRYRDRFEVPVIGVTGSVGKTTTKDLIAAALGRAFRVLANPGNLNTDVGLPLTVFRLGPEHELVCLEMAMRGPGEIARLASIARPRTGVLTNIGPVHLETLGSLEAITRAKEELLWALPPDGSAVLNADDPIVAGLAATHRPRLARVLTYGLDRPADVSGTVAGPAAAGGVRFRVALSGPARESAGLTDLGEFRIPLLGRHSVLNALAAVAVGLLYGAGPEAMRSGLDRAGLSAMRQEIIEVGGVRVVNDAYNAGPASMAAALDLLAEMRSAEGGRAVAVLGDMLELGGLSDEAHREVGRQAARLGLDHLVAVGPKAALLAEAAVEEGLDPGKVEHLADRRAAAAAALRALVPGDVVLVKGSRGMRLEEVVAGLVAALSGAPAAGGREEGGA